MNRDLTAKDLWPLIRNLPHDKQVRLARLALLEAARNGAFDAEAYQAAPPSPGEFSSDEDPLTWEADGWEEFDAAR